LTAAKPRPNYTAGIETLSWEELAGAHPLDFRITNAAERLAKTSDRWRDALTRKQSLEAALQRSKSN